MKPIRERCTIVIAGSWNQEIFTPAWITNVLSLDSQPSLNLILGPGGLTFRLDLDGILLDVTPHQVLFGPPKFSDDSFGTIEAAAISILKRLRETPVRGVGVNFGFDVPEAGKALGDLFRLSDEQLLSTVGAALGFTTITRKLLVNGHILNLTARRDGGWFRLDFNYHHDAKNADEAVAHLENHVIALKANALEFAEKVYGLSVEAT